MPNSIDLNLTAPACPTLSVECMNVYKGLREIGSVFIQRATASVSFVSYQLSQILPKAPLIPANCFFRFEQLPDQVVMPRYTTDSQRGHAFFYALSLDLSLPRHFRWFCRGQYLAANDRLTQSTIDLLEKQLRFVVFKLRTSSEPFRQLIELIAIEASVFAENQGPDAFVQRMYGLAYLEQIKFQYRNLPLTLFNLGIVQFKLNLIDLMIREKLNLMSASSDASQALIHSARKQVSEAQIQSTLAYANRYLEDRLYLPRSIPIQSNPLQSELSDCQLDQIAHFVTLELTRDNNEPLINFLSTWSPWTTLLSQLPELAAPLERIRQRYVNGLEQATSVKWDFLFSPTQMSYHRVEQDISVIIREYNAAQFHLFQRVTTKYLALQNLN